MESMDEMERRGRVEGEKGKPVVRDIRRYYCDYCGIFRSKKCLIRSHLLSHHKEEMEAANNDLHDGTGVAGEKAPNTCEECGASFSKPAYLRQHMQSHSLQRPFRCPLDDCHCSYRRKDHLERHLLKHQGKLFACPVENCNGRFSVQANMKRHVKEFHDDESPAVTEKQHICQEAGCGKKFKYASQLRNHEDAHVKLDALEVVCGEPGCLRFFTNSDCLKAHMHSCHRYVRCEVCGSRQLKKNFKRHKQMHDTDGDVEKIKCSFDGCQCSFSNKSNLNTHVKAVHQQLRPFSCRVSGCGRNFSYKHVRDNHETSCGRAYVQGDFIESDEQFRSRPRGGRKRKPISVESLMRKRVVPPEGDSALDDGQQYLRWLLGDDRP